MFSKALSVIVIITSMPMVATAGRHSIAREEATKIVENRFAQFYRDEASRKQAEQQAMEQEILKAKDIEAAMLRDLEQSIANQNTIRSAEELEQSMQRELADLTNDHDATLNGSATSFDHNNTREDHPFFDLQAGSKENNPFLFLQDLALAEPTKKAAGIREVIESLQSLPDHQQLSEEFARDLAKISPEMAREFTAVYKAKLADPQFPHNPSKKDQLRSTKMDHSGSKAKNGEAKQRVVAIVNGQELKNNPKAHLKIKDLHKIKTFNAITNYSFTPDKLYQIYTAPHKVTVIVLEPGEKIIGNPICGDPVRWKISTINNTTGQHVTIQPLREGIKTSITIATNQGRLYLLEATSLKNNYMAVVRWSYGTK